MIDSAILNYRISLMFENNSSNEIENKLKQFKMKTSKLDVSKINKEKLSYKINTFYSQIRRENTL